MSRAGELEEFIAMAGLFFVVRGTYGGHKLLAYVQWLEDVEVEMPGHRMACVQHPRIAPTYDVISADAFCTQSSCSPTHLMLTAWCTTTSSPTSMHTETLATLAARAVSCHPI